MRFLWFWAFWHWSRESFQADLLLHDPLEEIGSHWDEWYTREATREELESIERAGKSPSERRAFILWLIRRWRPTVELTGNRQIVRFVLNQLAGRKPFSAWAEFSNYRSTYRSPGVRAVILSEKSLGEKADVRGLESILMPMEKPANAPPVLAEGFRADRADLVAPWEAAQALLAGKVQRQFLLRWIAGGKRPYSKGLSLGLKVGWLALGAGLLYLVYGPEPGAALAYYCAAALGVWGLLLTTAIVVCGFQCLAFWRQGRLWCQRLREGQSRLLLSGNIILKGGSAGLAFCINILLATYRAYPEPENQSWLWRAFFRSLRANAKKWAATGVITNDGRILPVALEAKIRACERNETISQLLVPRQRAIKRNLGKSEVETQETVARDNQFAVGASGKEAQTFGFAAEATPFRVHPVSNLSEAVMKVAELRSGWQIWTNLFALVVSVTMIAALPDIVGIVFPPIAPSVILPTSPSPYYLWISLDTTSPDDFQVALESHFWTNRRVAVSKHEGPLGSVRAEIGLLRLNTPTAVNIEDGIVWIERRRKFLTREYDPGERVGRYSYSYVSHLHE